MRFRGAAICAAAVIVTCTTLVAGAAQAANASIPATQVWDAPSTAYDVNDAGTVAGYLGDWPNVRAVTWNSQNVISYLDLPADATSSIAVAINNLGQVAGQINLAAGQEAVVWNSDGAITRLGFLPGGSFSSGQDINDNGWVVGVANAAGTYNGFMWDGAGPIEALPMPTGAASTYAQAINNEGSVAGSAYVSFGPSLALVWEESVTRILDPLAEGAMASTSDINDAGQVVGNSSTTVPPATVRDAVLWDGDDPLDLGGLGGSYGLATAINSLGDVAGYMTYPSMESRGFVWHAGTRTLLDPLAGDTHSMALGMNSVGEIVGISTTTTGQGRAVRWTQALDTTPPELTVSVSPSVLWPPSHKYVTVQATSTATDEVDPTPTITVDVTSNEPDNGSDDGNTVNDIVIVDQDSFQLRAERCGVGSGRIYTIAYTATDASGNSVTQSATVTVPLEP